nr:PREDICTED: zymogen granule protein 16 homolog B [Equus przewalskii]
MLLWLTLALLWSTTCWAGQIYGLGGGQYFSTTPDYDNDITGIRVSVGSVLGLIKSIQLRHGSFWSERHGAEGGKTQEFLLRPGEHIIAILGSYKGYLRYLVVYTDQGRSAAFGREEGNSFTAFPDQPWRVLTGIFGHHKLLGITSIGFQWDDPREELTTQPGVTWSPVPPLSERTWLEEAGRRHPGPAQNPAGPAPGATGDPAETSFPSWAVGCAVTAAGPWVDGCSGASPYLKPMRERHKSPRWPLADTSCCPGATIAVQSSHRLELVILSYDLTWRRGKATDISKSLGTLQPEAMLLWLTLALLWSTTCWAEQTYGLGGGKYFSTAPDYHNDVTGIRVSVAPALGLIKNIQLRRGSSWTVRHGEEGGKVQEFLLRPGEHIIAVHGSYKGYLRYLVVHTDQGRLASFGQAEGNTFSAYPDQQWQVLTGVFGHHKLLGLTSIGFHARPGAPELRVPGPTPLGDKDHAGPPQGTESQVPPLSQRTWLQEAAPRDPGPAQSRAGPAPDAAGDSDSAETSFPAWAVGCAVTAEGPWVDGCSGASPYFKPMPERHKSPRWLLADTSCCPAAGGCALNRLPAGRPNLASRPLLGVQRRGRMQARALPATAGMRSPVHSRNSCALPPGALLARVDSCEVAGAETAAEGALASDLLLHQWENIL